MNRNNLSIVYSHAAFSVLLLFCLLLIQACNPTPEPATSPSPTQPRNTSISRVVSLAPSITEMLFALQQGDKVVGVTQYCTYPPDAQSREIIGGFSTPSLEAVVRCNPDAVVMLAEHQSLRAQLEQLDIHCIIVDHINIDGIHSSIATLGKSLEASQQAQKLLEDLNHRMGHIRNLTQDQPRPMVLLSVGRHGGEGIQSLFIAGPGSYFDDLIRTAGGENAYDGDVPYPSISAEGAMQLNPDVIIDIVPDLAPEAIPSITEDWQTVAETPAVKNGRVHVLGQDYVAVPGPRYALVLEQMARAFHPDLEWDTP